MSMDLEYIAVDWKRLNQLPTEQDFLTVLEEGKEKWFFHLNEMDASLNTNQFTAMAWLDQKGIIPEDTWKTVAELLAPVSAIELFDEDEALPFSSQSWSPPDQESICMSIGPKDVKQWIKSYDSIDWATVSKIVFSVCVSNPVPDSGSSVNHVFPYLQMWRDGFQEAADKSGCGVLIMYRE